MEKEAEERSYVYMVRCTGGQLYTGWTNDPGARLHAHKSGKGAKSTRAMGAVRFAYLERCADKSDALKREAALKKLTKAKKEALCAEWEEQHLPRLSVATRADAADIVEIYNWYVLNHTATFQVTPSTVEEYEDWVDNTLKVAPLLLARDANGKLLGYACAHRWHPREAYDWSVESTIYCAPDARGFGVGDLLYRALLDCWNSAAIGTCTPSWRTRTRPASTSTKSWASPAWAAHRTRPINSAGWDFPLGGWPCAPETRSRTPSGWSPRKRLPLC